jgi:hypothetical protein
MKCVQVWVVICNSMQVCVGLCYILKAFAITTIYCIQLMYITPSLSVFFFISLYHCCNLLYLSVCLSLSICLSVPVRLFPWLPVSMFSFCLFLSFLSLSLFFLSVISFFLCLCPFSLSLSYLVQLNLLRMTFPSI